MSKNRTDFSELHLTAKKYIPDGKGGYIPDPNAASSHSKRVKDAGKATKSNRIKFEESLTNGSKTPARGKWGHIRKRRGQMNKTESTYANHLDALQSSGQILQWWYEAITIKLASDTRYIPDFLVQLPDGELVLHEVKGAPIMFTPDAKVKVKVCAAMLPFRIFVVMPRTQKMGGGFTVTEVSNDE